MSAADAVTAGCPAGDRIDPRDERIDVRAKFALARMRDRNPELRADAIRLICAVHRGQVAGIYGDDLQRAALLAARLGTVRWQLVPATEDAALVLDPAAPQAPTVIFRGDTPDISKSPLRLDNALAKVGRVVQRRLAGGRRDKGSVQLIRHPLLHYLWSRSRGDQPQRATRLALVPPATGGELNPDECIDFDDHRTAVFASLTVPFRFVCSVGAEFTAGTGASVTAFGTGTLISPRHVLTSGHVAAMLTLRGNSGWDVGADATRLIVVPGRNHAASVTANRRPRGLLEVERVTLSGRLQQARTRGTVISDAELIQFDYALLTLKTSVDPKTYGFWGTSGTVIREIAARDIVNTPIRLSGYPGDKCRLLPPRGSGTSGMLRDCFVRTSPPGCGAPLMCQMLGDLASTQWQTPGMVLSSPPGNIQAPLAFNLEASVCAGMSGSPIWIQRGGQHLLVGIWAAFLPKFPVAFGTRIHGTMLAELRSSLQRDGVQPHF